MSGVRWVSSPADYQAEVHLLLRTDRGVDTARCLRQMQPPLATIEHPDPDRVCELCTQLHRNDLVCEAAALIITGQEDLVTSDHRAAIQELVNDVAARDQQESDQ